MCNDLVQPDRPLITRRIRFAYWITKATDTHSEYETIIGFPLEQWLHERASMLCYTCNVCLVKHCPIIGLAAKL